LTIRGLAGIILQIIVDFSQVKTTNFQRKFPLILTRHDI